MIETAASCPEACADAVQRPEIWEFPIADFLVCARQDTHGLYLLSPTARVAWEILKEGHTLGRAAETFAQTFGISDEQAFEDVSRAWGEWDTGLFAPSGRATDLHSRTGLQTQDRAANEQDEGPARDDKSGPVVFSADYSVFGKVIRLRLFDADVAWDLTPRVEPFRITYSADTQHADTPDADIEVYAGNEAFHIRVNGVHVSTETAVFATRVIVLQEFLRASSSQNWVAVLHAGACGVALTLRCVSRGIALRKNDAGGGAGTPGDDFLRRRFHPFGPRDFQGPADAFRTYGARGKLAGIVDLVSWTGKCAGCRPVGGKGPLSYSAPAG